MNKMSNQVNLRPVVPSTFPDELGAVAASWLCATFDKESHDTASPPFCTIQCAGHVDSASSQSLQLVAVQIVLSDRDSQIAFAQDQSCQQKSSDQTKLHNSKGATSFEGLISRRFCRVNCMQRMQTNGPYIHLKIVHCHIARRIRSLKCHSHPTGGYLQSTGCQDENSADRRTAQTTMPRR